MLFLLITWLIFGGLWWAIGHGLFTLLRIPDSQPHASPLDTLQLKLFWGMGLTGLVWYLIALWLPLTFGLAIATLALLLLCCCGARRWPPLTLKIQRWMGILAVFAIGVAWLTSQPITAYDTGLYHYPAIKWLANYGAVPGLALFYFVLAYPSSWLGLSAPFEDLLPGQAGTVISGLTVLVTLAKLWPCLVRIHWARSSLWDWFWVLTSAFGLGILLFFGLPISPSPDVGVICFGSWILLTWGESIQHPPSRRDLIPWGLAIAALGCKTTALPFLVVVVLWLLVRYRHQWRTHLLLLIGTGVLVSPLLLFGVQTSGCPLFPAHLFCVEQLPWSVGAEQARSFSKIIQEGARWQHPIQLPKQYTWLDWFIPWLTKQRQATFLLLSNLLMGGVALGWSFRRGLRSRAQSWRTIAPTVISPYWSLWLLVILGTALVFFGSPNTRFGIVYLSILPSLWGAKLCAARSRLRWLTLWWVGLGLNLWLAPSPSLWALLLALVILSVIWHGFSQRLVPDAFVAVLVVLTVAITSRTSLATFRYQTYWLRPAPLEPLNDVALVKRQQNDVEYFSPDPAFRWERPEFQFSTREDRCWDAPLPCAPEITVPEIQLRQPERGLRGGFVRVEAAQ